MNQKGFTLVEVAIVVVIIGLLIGGVMKGRTLLESAKMKSFIANCKNIDTAVTQFNSKYLGMPGDLASPATKLPNCTTAPCNLAGNMDRLIRGAGGAAAINVNTSPLAADQERMAAWAQLYAAGLITSVNGSATMEIGTGLPENGYSNGLMVGYVNAVNVSYDITAQNVLMTLESVDATTGVFTTEVMIPSVAARIDSMADDGLPNRGTIQANSSAFAAATNCRASDTTYRENSEIARCGLYYLLSVR